MDRRQFVEMLGYDPILIAMFADLAKSTSTDHMHLLAQEIIERFVDSAEAEAAVRDALPGY